MTERPTIFISCGQRTAEEKQLGEEVGKLIEKHTKFQPYFAQTQNSLEGLTRHIFDALSRASGFIAILHRRGSVVFDTNIGIVDLVRASVWVEQEIAIAAFIQQSLKKPLNVLAFIEEGIGFEGVRQYVLLNPITFRNNEDVLTYLERVLPTWPQQAVSLPTLDLKILPSQREWSQNFQGNRYDEFAVDLKNDGSEPVSSFILEVEFPRPLLNASTHYAAMIPERSNNDIAFFRITEAGHRSRMPIHPGDPLRVFSVEFLHPTDGEFQKRVVLRIKLPGNQAKESHFHLS